MEMMIKIMKSRGIDYDPTVGIEQENQRRKERREAIRDLGSWYMRQGRDGIENGYDGSGCNNGKCMPECRYYANFGRIEDEEVIQRHKEIEERYRKRNAII
jgi:hypothetical protein